MLKLDEVSHASLHSAGPQYLCGLHCCPISHHVAQSVVFSTFCKFSRSVMNGSAMATLPTGCRTAMLPDGFGRVLRPYLTFDDIQRARIAFGFSTNLPPTLIDFWDSLAHVHIGSVYLPREQQLFIDLQLLDRESGVKELWGGNLYSPEQLEEKPGAVPVPVVARSFKWVYWHRLRYNSAWRWGVEDTELTSVLARLGLLEELKQALRDGWNITDDALDIAAERGDLRMVRWLHESAHVQWYSTSFTAALQGMCTGPAGTTAACGQYVCDTALLEYLRDKSCPVDLPAAVRLVVQAGHVGLCQWLWETSQGRGGKSQQAMRQALVSIAVPSAVEYGHVPVLQWCVDTACLRPASCAQAASHGHVPVLAWLREHGVAWGKALHSAALGGQAQALEWCIRHGASMDGETGVWKESVARGWTAVLRAAVEGGHAIPMKPALCALAAGHGKLETLQYLRLEQGACWTKSTAYEACKHGHIQVLAWCLEQGCPVNAKLLFASLQNKMAMDMEEWLLRYLERKAKEAGDVA